MSKINPKVFCSLPFIHICNRVDGYYMACCHAEDVILRDDGTPFAIHEGDTFEAAFKSNYMQSLRENMQKGVRDPRCQICWKLEDQGISSKRQDDGGRFEQQALSRLEMKPLPFEPLSWDIKLGSHCNLKCRMCGPQTSTALMMEAVENGWESKEEGLKYVKTRGNFLNYSWFKEELEKLIPYAEEIYFLGGEPSVIPQHLEIIDVAIAAGCADKITLRWSTNLSNFDSRFLDRAKHFKNVLIDCSIDGFGAVNEYIRYPLKWDKIEQRIDEIKSKCPHAILNNICTVQIYNIFTLNQLNEWCIEKGIECMLNFLHYPIYLSTENLPVGLSTQLSRMYADSPHERLHPAAKWLNSKGDPTHLREFFHYTERLDRARGQNFMDIVPEQYRKEILRLKKEVWSMPEWQI